MSLRSSPVCIRWAGRCEGEGAGLVRSSRPIKAEDPVAVPADRDLSPLIEADVIIVIVAGQVRGACPRGGSPGERLPGVRSGTLIRCDGTLPRGAPDRLREATPARCHLAARPVPTKPALGAA